MPNRYFAAMQPLEWPRWSEYVSADSPLDGWFYAAGDRNQSLSLSAAVDLASSLAKVARPVQLGDRIAALRRFYEDYGLLGRQMGGPLGLTREGIKPHATTFNGQRQVRAGDPVMWALDHAENVARILRAISPQEWPRLRRELGMLIDAADALPDASSRDVEPATCPSCGDSQDCVAYDDVSAAQRVISCGRCSAITIYDLKRPARSHRPSPTQDVSLRTLQLLTRGVARHMPTISPPWKQPFPATLDRSKLLAELLNPNLGTIRLEIDPATGEPRFRFLALLEVVYWQLWYRVSGADIRRCENPQCRAPFFARERRQRFCPAPPGKESRCARVCRSRLQSLPGRK